MASEDKIDDVQSGFNPAVIVEPSKDRFVFLCYKSPESWPSRVEDFEVDLFPMLLLKAIENRKADSEVKTHLIIFERPDGCIVSDGDILIFPDNFILRNISESNINLFLEYGLMQSRDQDSSVSVEDRPSLRSREGSLVDVEGRPSLQSRDQDSWVTVVDRPSLQSRDQDSWVTVEGRPSLQSREGSLVDVEGRPSLQSREGSLVHVEGRLSLQSREGSLVDIEDRSPKIDKEVLTDTCLLIFVRSGVSVPNLIQKFKEEIESKGLKDDVVVTACFDIGENGNEYNVTICNANTEGKIDSYRYSHVTPEIVPELLDQHFKKGETFKRIWRGRMGASVEEDNVIQNQQLDVGNIENTSHLRSYRTPQPQPQPPQRAQALSDSGNSGSILVRAIAGICGSCARSFKRASILVCAIAAAICDFCRKR